MHENGANFATFLNGDHRRLQNVMKMSDVFRHVLTTAKKIYKKGPTETPAQGISTERCPENEIPKQSITVTNTVYFGNRPAFYTQYERSCYSTTIPRPHFKPH